MTLSGTEIQPFVFLAVIGAGFIAAIIYSANYIIRYLSGFKRVIEVIVDTFFVVISASLYFIAIYFTGYGEFRIYTLIGFLLGFFTMYFLLHPLKKYMPKIQEKLQKIRKLPFLNKIFK